MMQAIVTKYLGPTNHRGSRVKATACAGSVTMAWDYELDTDGNHLAAAEALRSKYGWALGELAVGGLPDGCSNCYVFVKRAGA